MGSTPGGHAIDASIGHRKNCNDSDTLGCQDHEEHHKYHAMTADNKGTYGDCWRSPLMALLLPLALVEALFCEEDSIILLLVAKLFSSIVFLLVIIKEYGL